MSDAELNKAALLIAKLLIRTREGKIQWKNENDLLSQTLTSCSSYRAEMDDGLEAHLSRDDKELGFKLSGPPAVDLPAYYHLAGMLGGRNSNEVISITLNHSHGKTGLVESPETIVYRDLAELIFLAENPKSVSDDLRYQQALTYLDKLSA
jgi:hypothetical protein